ncbi:MAG: hypothetical protein M5R36_20395 [Deltaproteobacteria bacterium]|nr:hypothetical protein [Deltaproteobacteria bacterium]
MLLEADWTPAEVVRVHAVFRAARSGSLRADKFAQVPDIVADTKYNYDEDVQQTKIDRVHDEFYEENDLREIYIDVDAARWLNFRIGRQQVVWGRHGDLPTARLHQSGGRQLASAALRGFSGYS